MAAARKRQQDRIGREPGASVIAKGGFISARSIKGEYHCDTESLVLLGGKDGKYELRLGGKLSSSGTYYCEHNEHIDLEVLLEPDGGARRTAVVNLRHKQFTWAERSASAATTTTPTTAEATWTRYVDESGHAYLYCAATGESRWDEPPA